MKSIPTCMFVTALVWVTVEPGHATAARSGQPPARSLASGLSRPDAAKTRRIADAYGKLPLGFEANRGQTDAGVQFVSRGAGYTLFLKSTEAVLALRNAPHALRMKLVAGNPAPRVSHEDELPGKSNYIIGRDHRNWHTDVPRYGKVRYREVYPGVDLVYYSNQQQLEYDFIVAPGANTDVIALEFEGAGNIHVDTAGDLVLGTGEGEVRLKMPVMYQEIDGRRQDIPGHYVMRDRDRVGFQVSSYDVARPLVVDPVLVYSTYLGGSVEDFAHGIAVDPDGSAFVTGYTLSVDFPTTSVSSAQPGCAGVVYEGSVACAMDAFVIKLSPDGTSIVYSTYLGGTGDDVSYAIAVDSAGSAYVTGATRSNDFPTVNPVQPALGSNPDYHQDAFVAKLSADGSALLYSTYLGGTENEFGYGIAVDNGGSAYVTGQTDSANFPTAQPLQPTLHGASDAFVARLTFDGSALVYSTYLGGTSSDVAYAIAVDGAGYVSITGETTSTNFPAVHAFQVGNAGYNDAFVARLTPDGAALVYSTYLGGSGYEAGTSVATDDVFTYVTGFTSGGFPVQTTLQTEFAGQLDAFVAKFDGAGHRVYSTYLGGSGVDRGSAIAVDPAGNVLVAGVTDSPDFPSVNPLQAQVRDVDIFVTKVNPDGYALVYSTYLGGTGPENEPSFDAGKGPALAVDTIGHAYVAGFTYSPDFPTAAAIQAANSGYLDAVVAKIFDDGTISARPDLSIVEIQPPFYGGDLIYWFRVTNNGPGLASEVRLTDQLPEGATFKQAGFVFGGYADCAFESGALTCGLPPLPPGVPVDLAIFLASPTSATVTNTATVTAREPDVDNRDNTVTSTRLLPDPSLIGGIVNEFGRYITYGYRILNNGPGVSGPVTFTDVLPAGVELLQASIGSEYPWTQPVTCPMAGGVVTCQVGSLGSGSAIVLIHVMTQADGLLINTATVSSSGPDYDMSNNTLTSTTEFIRRQADVSVAQSRTPEVAIPGSTLSYTFDVTNNGPSDATLVNLIDHLSSGETFVSAMTSQGSCSSLSGDDFGVVVGCSIDMMPAGTLARVTIVVRVTGVAPLSNTATVTSQVEDPQFDNNSVTIVTPVNRLPIANAGPDQILPAGSTCQAIVTLNGSGSIDADGDTLTYTWTIDNLLPPPVVLMQAPSGTVTGPTPTGPLPLGTHTITLTVNDGHGGTASDTVVVTVRDSTPPTFSGVPAPMTIEQASQSGTSLSVATPTAADNCGSDAVSGNAPAIFPPGPTTVTFTAHDAAGNSATTATTVTVVDSTPPTFSGVPPPMTVEQAGPSGTSVAVPMPTANDTVSGAVAVSGNAPAIFPPGPTTVTFTAHDAAGNSATTATTVTVVDTVPPMLAIASPQAQSYVHTDNVTMSFSATDAGSGLGAGTLIAALDGGAVVNGQTISMLTLALGTHSFVLTAMDVAGNSRTQNITFTVVATVDSLIASVNVFAGQNKIDEATANSLLVKLNDAKQAVQRGKTTAALGKLQEFIDQVSAQSGRHIAADAAQILLADAQYVMGAL